MPSDYAARESNRILAQTERRVRAIYRKAAKDAAAEVAAWRKEFEGSDEQMKLKLSEKAYAAWRREMLARGNSLQSLADQLSRRYLNAHETALSYISERACNIYQLNYNYSAYSIERQVPSNFTLVPDRVVRNIVRTQPDLIWNSTLFTQGVVRDVVTSGVARGLSIPRMADELLTRVPNACTMSATRAARTATTYAQNRGRQDCYEEARGMGIKIRKRWVATFDSRTRPEHSDADGQTVDVDEPFIVGGEELMEPGDTSASTEMTINCRCSMIAVVDGFDDNYERRVGERGDRAVVPVNMSFAEWQKRKQEVVV